MLLTGLAPDPRRPDYRLVEVDRGRFASLPAESLIGLGLVVGGEIGPRVLARLQELADLEGAHRAALRALARRAHARHYAAVKAARGRGPARLIKDLLAQGVERSVAEQAVRAALVDEGVDADAA